VSLPAAVGGEKGYILKPLYRKRYRGFESSPSATQSGTQRNLAQLCPDHARALSEARLYEKGGSKEGDAAMFGSPSGMPCHA